MMRDTLESLAAFQNETAGEVTPTTGETPEPEDGEVDLSTGETPEPEDDEVNLSEELTEQFKLDGLNDTQAEAAAVRTVAFIDHQMKAKDDEIDKLFAQLTGAHAQVQEKNNEIAALTIQHHEQRLAEKKKQTEDRARRRTQLPGYLPRASSGSGADSGTPSGSADQDNVGHLPPPAAGNTDQDNAGELPPPAAGNTDQDNAGHLPPPAAGNTDQDNAGHLPPPAAGNTDQDNAGHLPPPAAGNTDQDNAGHLPPPAAGTAATLESVVGGAADLNAASCARLRTLEHELATERCRKMERAANERAGEREKRASEREERASTRQREQIEAKDPKRRKTRDFEKRLEAVTIQITTTTKELEDLYVTKTEIEQMEVTLPRTGLLSTISKKIADMEGKINNYKIHQSYWQTEKAKLETELSSSSSAGTLS